MEAVGTTLRGSGVVVLVALQHFDAAGWAKALLASASALGLLLSPIVVIGAARTRVSPGKAVALLHCIAAPGLVLAAFSQSFTFFMAGILTAIPLLAGGVPLVTALWEQNTEPATRGRFFSHVTIAGTVAGMGGAAIISILMNEDITRYRPILAVAGLFVLAGGTAAALVPGRPIAPSSHHAHPLAGLRLIREDRIFGYLCAAQMLLGLGNLATLPLRTEYAGSSTLGMGLGPGIVLGLVIVIPEAARLLSIAVWGRLFDQWNFIVLRLVINLFFAFSIILFFIPNAACMVVGGILFGIATGGGKIAWTLWVTKFAPSDKTADYMAVHTFLTGLRGVAAPQLAYAALAAWTVPQVGWCGAALVFSACVMLLAVIPKNKRR